MTSLIRSLMPLFKMLGKNLRRSLFPLSIGYIIFFHRTVLSPKLLLHCEEKSEPFFRERDGVTDIDMGR